MSGIDASVLIVGAGPVGLLIALALGKANISTIVLEKYTSSSANSERAMVYQPVVLECLRGLGILEKVNKLAYLNHEGIVWRDETGKALAQMPVDDSETILLLGQKRMTDFLREELKQYSSVTFWFGKQFVGIDQANNDIQEGLEKPTDTGIVTALIRNTAATNDDDIVVRTRYVLGTDGANSSVRRCLCIPFEGFTWTDFSMIGCDVLYDFSKSNNWGTPMQFIVHPKDWAVIVYTGQDKNGEPYGNATPLFRVAYGESNDLDMSNREEVMKRANERVKRYANGDSNFEITRAEPYRLQQRCAALSHKGNVFLAGDALHSNNPIGGLGLTTGILDAFCYGNALVRVIEEKASPELLVQCAESRRQAFLRYTNQASIRNLKILLSEDPEDIEMRQHFFNNLKTNKDFPKQARAQMSEMLPDTFSEQS